MPGLFFPSSKPKFVNQQRVIAELKKLALKIAGKNRNIESVYLFGSYAQELASLHSDADILVILTRDKQKMMQRLDKFILEFSDGPVPIDVLVYTRAELNKALKEGNRFLARAVAGIKLV